MEIQFSLEERFNYVAIRKVHRLTISETFRSDAGEYTFIAGKNRSTMNLRVNSKSNMCSTKHVTLSQRHVAVPCEPTRHRACSRLVSCHEHEIPLMSRWCTVLSFSPRTSSDPSAHGVPVRGGR